MRISDWSSRISAMAATISPAIRARSGAGNIWRNRFIAMSFCVGRTGPRRIGSGGRERMLPGGPEGRHAPSGAVALNLMLERGGDMQQDRESVVKGQGG